MPKKRITLPPHKKRVVMKKDANRSENRDWAWDQYNIEGLHKRGWYGKGERIAIMDTGYNDRHPDLFGTVIHAEDIRTYKPRKNPKELFIQYGDGILDKNFHSTWIHGRFSAVHNGIGVQGQCPEAEIVILKVFDDRGSGDPEWNTIAYQRAYELGCTLTNYSGGISWPIQSTRAVLKKVTKDGRMINFCAAGNDGKRAHIDFPGTEKETIAVMSHNKKGKDSQFTDSGKEAGLIAPGEDVLSTYGYSDYALLDGTSMATPIALGIFACVRKPLEDQFGVKITLENLGAIVKFI